MANNNDLTTRNGVADYMALSTTATDWNARCNEVKAANDGYPGFWYSTIVMSGLSDQIAAKWGGTDEIEIVPWSRG